MPPKRRLRKPIMVVKDMRTGFTHRSRMANYSLEEHLARGFLAGNTLPEEARFLRPYHERVPVRPGGFIPPQFQDIEEQPGFDPDEFDPDMEFGDGDEDPRLKPLPRQGENEQRRIQHANDIQTYLPFFATVFGGGAIECRCGFHDFSTTFIFCIGIKGK